MNRLNRIALSFVAALSLSTSLVAASPTNGKTAVANGVLAPEERKIFRVELKADEDWRLEGFGYGEDGDLDCYVLDENGGVVGKDNDSTNTCLITGHPRWTGIFRVVVVNVGEEPLGFKVEID